MLDIRLVREQPDLVKKRLALRAGSDDAKIDELLRLDAERRKAETALQALNAERKKLSKEIGGKRSRGEDSAALEERVRAIGDEIASSGEQTAFADEKERDLLLQIPNLPHPDAPIGDDPSANRVVRDWGKKPEIADAIDWALRVLLKDVRRRDTAAARLRPNQGSKSPRKRAATREPS